MIERTQIERVLTRLPELETELSDPATAANQKLFRELVQEHASLKKLEQQTQRYLSLERDIEEHRELAADADGDPELIELAQGELVELEAELPDAIPDDDPPAAAPEIGETVPVARGGE